MSRPPDGGERRRGGCADRRRSGSRTPPQNAEAHRHVFENWGGEAVSDLTLGRTSWTRSREANVVPYALLRCPENVRCEAPDCEPSPGMRRVAERRRQRRRCLRARVCPAPRAPAQAGSSEDLTAEVPKGEFVDADGESVVDVDGVAAVAAPRARPPPGSTPPPPSLALATTASGAAWGVRGAKRKRRHKYRVAGQNRSQNMACFVMLWYHVSICVTTCEGMQCSAM